MKRYYRKNRSSVALFLVSNLLAAGSSVFMSFLLGTFADSAMEGDLSRVWKIALVTLFYLCIETFFAFLLDYSRDIIVQRVPVVYIKFQNRERHEEGPKHASFFPTPLWNKIGRSAILFGVQMLFHGFAWNPHGSAGF